MRIIIISLFVAIISLSCNSTDPEIKVPEREKSFIEAADVSCDEIWLKLKVGEIDLPAAGVIRIDGTKEKLFSVTTKDTILYIDSLEVNRNYKFQVILLNQGQTLISNEVTVKTLDTTSHNFTLETYEFGEYGNNVLYDVAVIDENNIWAVGEIFLKDSLGNNDHKRYNAIHFDGTKWEVLRIPYDYYGTLFYHPIQSIYTFNSNEIWFCGNGVIMWNGRDFIPKEIPSNVWGSYQINKIWGTSSSNLYIVGNNGSMAHYDGTNWTKIESGTNVDLVSIWGSPDGKVIWACGHDDDSYYSVLLRSKEGQWEKIFEGPSSYEINGKPIGFLRGGWTRSESMSYISNNQYLYQLQGSDIQNLEKKTNYYGELIFSINGPDRNDFFVSGQHGLVGHYNGVSYKIIEEFRKPSEYLYSVYAGERVIAAVGENLGGFYGSKAVIHIMRR